MREIWITTIEYIDGTHEEYEDVTLTMHDSGNVVMITSNIENEKIFIPLNSVKKIVGINYSRGLKECSSD